MTAVFAWVQSRGHRKPYPAKYPCGIPKTIESFETVLAQFNISREEEELDLGILAERYPCPEIKDTAETLS